MIRAISILALIGLLSACSKNSSDRVEYVVSTVAGSGLTGSLDGMSTAASFTTPVGIAVDAQGNIFIADDGAHRVRKIAPDGMVTTLAGSVRGFADGHGAAAKFTKLNGITTDGAGNVYVTDATRIRKITADGVVSTIAGTAESLSIDGSAAIARFIEAHEILFDSKGNLIVTDYGGNLGIPNKLRKITANGDVNTVVPSIQSTYGLSGDTEGNVYLPRPWDQQIIKIESNGNEQVLINKLNPSILNLLYDQQGGFYCGQSGILSDYHTIYKLSTKGVLLSIAGNGQVGYRDGNGIEAQFHHPGHMALDAQHNIYVIDAENRRIRKISQK